MLLGIDVGTTKVKACLVDSRGNIVSSASVESRIIISEGNKVEQRADDIWNSVVAVVRKVTRKKGKIKALSLSTQGGTLFPFNQNNNPLMPGITWMDRRADDIGKKLCKQYRNKFFFNLVGRKPDIGCLPLLQLIWLKKNQRKLFESVKIYHLVDSLLYWKMTGRIAIDPSSAVMTMLYDIKKGKWCKEILSLAGIKQSQLPEIVPSGEIVGYLSSRASDELGLSSETVVYSGGHDQYCAALGAGVINPGDIMLSCGTAWAIVAVSQKPIFNFSSGLSPGPHAVKNRWGLLTAIGRAGIYLDWIKDLLQIKNYKDVNYLAEKIPPGADSLLFLLQEEKADFLGLNINHSRGHLLRAVMEGLGFEVRKKLESIKRVGIKVKSLCMVGGAAKSSLWAQIIADITQQTVRIPAIKEAASYGAAVLAGARFTLTGTGRKRGFQDKIFKPRPQIEMLKKFEKILTFAK